MASGPLLSSFRTRVCEWAEANFADVLGLLQMFADSPDPDRFTPVVEDLADAQAGLAVTARQPDPLTGRLFRAQPDFAKISTVAPPPTSQAKASHYCKRRERCHT